MHPIIRDFGHKVRWLLSDMQKEAGVHASHLPPNLPRKQSELARELGITQSRLGNWLGKSVKQYANPDPKFADEIARIFGFFTGRPEFDLDSGSLRWRCLSAWRSPERQTTEDGPNDGFEDFRDAYLEALRAEDLIFLRDLNVEFTQVNKTKEKYNKPIVEIKIREFSILLEEIQMYAEREEYASDDNIFGKTREKHGKIYKLICEIRSKFNKHAFEMPIVFELQKELLSTTVRGRRSERAVSLISFLVSTSIAEAPNGAVFRDMDELWCPEMVLIPPGAFQMGATKHEGVSHANEGPQHWVNFDERLAVGRFPVTNQEYSQFCQDTGRTNVLAFELAGAKHPAVNVSWRDADAFANWLSRKTRQTYRLLTEAEWEYVCRSGTTTRFSFGNDLTQQQANHNGLIGHTTEVGSYPPNSWGVYDMHGNVWEWVQDLWHEDYKQAPEDGSAWLTGSDSRRVMRGGSWQDGPVDLRSANRSRIAPHGSNSDTGFRVARSISPG